MSSSFMSYSCQGATRSLYIHWPFCPYKCHFCPFVAIAGQDRFMERYNAALLKEVNSFVKTNSCKLSVDTIFLGGGTPSTWPDTLLLDTFGTLRKEFNFNEYVEVSIEVNPGTVRPEQFAVWKAAGINRLSIGVQGLKDSVLNNLNRKQSREDVLWVLQNAQKHFDNISVDLILGLPDVSESEWKELLVQVVEWPIKHVSIYFLTVHEETPLYYRVQKKDVILCSDDHMVDLYQWTINYLEQHGIHQYEISNFARDGYKSKHNSVYWDRKPYKAFGLGACSFDGSSRFQNQKQLIKYLNDVEQNKDVTMFCETLTSEQIYLERIMLGLRRSEGINIDEFTVDLTQEKKEQFERTVDILHKNQFLYKNNNRIVLSPAGLAVQNDIAARLSL